MGFARTLLVFGPTDFLLTMERLLLTFLPTAVACAGFRFTCETRDRERERVLLSGLWEGLREMERDEL